MSKDPERCCIVNATSGKRCENKPMYNIGARGFCEQHKPNREQTRRLIGTSTAATERLINHCGF